MLGIVSTVVCCGKKENVVIGEFVKEDSQLFILNLSYKIRDDVEFVFDEDTPYAIDIIEIYADGNKLSLLNEDWVFRTARSSFRKHKVTKNKKDYHMSMYWHFYYSNNMLCWNDGRGVIFETISGIIPNQDVTSRITNTYAISREMKQLEIKYRIVLPYPSLTIDNLYDLNYEHKIFTEEYSVTVDIGNVFEDRSVN